MDINDYLKLIKRYNQYHKELMAELNDSEKKDDDNDTTRRKEPESSVSGTVQDD